VLNDISILCTQHITLHLRVNISNINTQYSSLSEAQPSLEILSEKSDF